MSLDARTQETQANREVVLLLQGALQNLKQHNELLSVRAIAKHLDLSPSYLSKVFRGERRLPLRLVAGLSKILRLDHHQIAQIQRLLLENVEEREVAALTGIRTLETRELNPIHEFETLSQKEYWLLDEWYYLPILNLVTTTNFNPTLEHVSQRLGITMNQASQSIAKMVEKGYLTANADSGWDRTQLKIRFPTQRSHSSVRAFHKKMIERSTGALASSRDEDFASRLISGIGFAADPTKIPEAKVILEEAIYKAVALLTEGECTEVFQLNLQLFKLTK